MTHNRPTDAHPMDRETCPYCSKPHTADHWQRIAASWERLAFFAFVMGLITGAGVIGIVWAAAAL